MVLNSGKYSSIYFLIIFIYVRGDYPPGWKGYWDTKKQGRQCVLLIVLTLGKGIRGHIVTWRNCSTCPTDLPSHHTLIVSIVLKICQEQSSALFLWCNTWTCLRKGCHVHRQPKEAYQMLQVVQSVCACHFAIIGLICGWISHGKWFNMFHNLEH